MNNNMCIKYWNDSEELQLIDEINNLTDINIILNNHDRKITGISMRIEKILNDPIKLAKIHDKKAVIDKYLTYAKNKCFISYDELYSNILKFNSLDDISNNYNKLSITKIKNILNDFLKKKDIDIAKKLRINCLLKSKDDLDFAEKIFNTKNDTKINTNNENDTNNINSIIIMLLDEIKMLRTDMFDVKNRVKIIMDKVCILEKNTTKKTKLKNNLLQPIYLSNINNDIAIEIDKIDKIDKIEKN